MKFSVPDPELRASLNLIPKGNLKFSLSYASANRATLKINAHKWNKLSSIMIQVLIQLQGSHLNLIKNNCIIQNVI